MAAVMSLCCFLLFSGSVYAASPLNLFRGLWQSDYRILDEESGSNPRTGLFAAQRPALSDRRDYLLLSGAFEDVYRAEGPAGDTIISFWTLEVLRVFPLGASGIAGTLKISGQENRLFCRTSIGGSKGRIGLSYRQRYWSVAYDGRPASWLRVEGGVGGRVADSDPSHMNGRLQLSVRLPSSWTVDLQASQLFRSNLLNAHWRDDALTLATEFAITTWGGSIAGPLGGWGRVRFAVDRFGLGHGNRSTGYVTHLSGDGWDAAIHCAVFPLPNWKIAGSVARGQGSGVVSGKLAEEEFSNSQLEGGRRILSLSSLWQPAPAMSFQGRYIKSIWRLDEGKGNLESWPFVSSFISLFDGRNWFLKGEASLIIEQYEIEPQYNFPSRIGLGGRLRFVRLIPKVHFISREWLSSDLLSILLPKTEKLEASISRAELLDVGVDVRWWIGKVGLRLEVAQIVPVRIVRAKTVGTEEKEAKTAGAKRRGGSSYMLSVMLQ